MKLGRLKHIGVATQQTQFVIASVAKQSRVAWLCSGLPRRLWLLAMTGGEICL
jgi:hypothetical protein